jgi:hypothetical protein
MSDYRPQVKLARLYEKTSKTGNQYFVGRIGSGQRLLGAVRPFSSRHFAQRAFREDKVFPSLGRAVARGTAVRGATVWMRSFPRDKTRWLTAKFLVSSAKINCEPAHIPASLHLMGCRSKL